MFSLGERRRLAGRAHVEADEDRLRRDGEVDVALGDGADARVDDGELHPLGRELVERVGDRFDRALHVGLDDDAQLLLIGLGHALDEVLERDLGARGDQVLVTLALRLSAISWAFFGSLTACSGSPASGTSERPRISTGVDGPASCDLLAVLVRHRADLAEAGAGEDEVADVQRAFL